MCVCVYVGVWMERSFTCLVSFFLGKHTVRNQPAAQHLVTSKQACVCLVSYIYNFTSQGPLEMAICTSWLVTRGGQKVF